MLGDFLGEMALSVKCAYKGEEWLYIDKVYRTKWSPNTSLQGETIYISACSTQYNFFEPTIAINNMVFTL